MIAVFYDGGCGLCRREITYYKRIAEPGRFDWIDLSKEPWKLSARGIAYESAMKHLHVEDDNQQMHTGIDAFIIIWQNIPYWKMASLIAALPFMKQLLKMAYERFAEWRYRRLALTQCER
jgi:predicted DCC family thiol-disulfide oxidoreductase YuxK